MSFPRTNAQRQKDVAALVAFFEAREDGEEVLWIAIEHQAGVPMDEHGKGLAREALRKIGRPYEALRGEGVRLSAPETSTRIMSRSFTRIDNSVRRAERTRKHLASRHLLAMTEIDKQKMTVLAGFFGTVRAFAKQLGPIDRGRLELHAEREARRATEPKPPGL